MRRLTCLAAALVLLVAAAPARAQTTLPAPADPQVVTIGEGSVQAVPDRAWITVSAESRAASAREAQRLNTVAMAPVQDALKAARVPPDAVRTVGYDLQQEFDFIKDRRVSKGYVARNAIEVRVDDVARVGELLELAVRQGATTVSGLRFDVKDQAKFDREALRQAVASARLKAEAAAAGAGRTIDRLVQIREDGVGEAPAPRNFRFQAVGVASAADSAPPIAAGQVEVTARVTTTWTLK